MNSRFSIAVHILTLLASAQEERLTSELIAASVGTNPAVIRRQLAGFRMAGLVDSKGARGGGWGLTRRANTITLGEVKAALGEEGSFRINHNEPHPDCPIGQNVRLALDTVYSEAERAVLQTLGKWTVQDMLDSVRETASAGRCGRTL